MFSLYKLPFFKNLISESGGVNIGPRKVRGRSSNAFDNLNVGETLRQLGDLDMRAVNNYPSAASHYRSRRATDEFVVYGPIVCFLAFLLASIFMVRVKGSGINRPRKTTKSTKTVKRDNRVENTLV